MLSKKKNLVLILLSLLLALSSLTISDAKVDAASVNYKVINTNSLNLRSGAGVQYKVIATLKKNTVVTKTSTNGKWFKVKVGPKTGYVSSRYLKKIVVKVSSSTSTKNSGKFYSVSVASLNIRKTSSATSSKIAVARFGDQYQIISQSSNGWYKVEYKKAKYGWLSNKYGYTTTSKANAYPKGTIFGPLSGRIITVDAGHGGEQAGAKYFGIKEKDLNLKAAKALQMELKKNGAKVVMTRTTDKTLSLEKRVSISKQANSDAFISVHHNVSNKNSEKGYLALYTKKSEKTFTNTIFKALKKPVSAVSTVPAEQYRYQSLFVLRESPIIGTLIEYGYMNRKDELTKIDTNSYRKAMAVGITNGIISYYK